MFSIPSLRYVVYVALHSGFWGDPGGACACTLVINSNYTFVHNMQKQRGEGLGTFIM